MLCCFVFRLFGVLVSCVSVVLCCVVFVSLFACLLALVFVCLVFCWYWCWFAWCVYVFCHCAVFVCCTCLGSLLSYVLLLRIGFPVLLVCLLLFL